MHKFLVTAVPYDKSVKRLSDFAGDITVVLQLIRLEAFERRRSGLPAIAYKLRLAK